MKRLTITVVAALLALAIASTAGAEDSKPAKSAQASKKLHAQTLCPVMGGEIDSAFYTDIQGQRVYHCCPACAAKLKADPDTYFKKAAADGVLFENIQKNCPVTGKPVSKTHHTDYVGRRVYFCSVDCAAKFAKDPQTYLKKLDPVLDKPSGGSK
jgi:YHS domain-containing protein